MQLKTIFQGREDIVVAYAFLRFDEKHSTRGILAGLVGQLLQHQANLSSPPGSHRFRIVLDCYAKEDTPGETELVDVLTSLVQTFEKVFIVIDGLDEAPESVREDLLSMLIPLPRVSVLITSRPLSHLIAHHAPHAACVTIQAHAEDISVYVAERARKSAKLQAILRISGQGQSIIATLSERIRDLSNGM